MPSARGARMQSPQTEAAAFYGLFLRGHSADTLRADIDIPTKTLQKWMCAREYDHSFREQLLRRYLYRKQVLAIFDALVSSDRSQAVWQ